ncbi:MAG: MBL fold metallo-hydrolase [Gemmatimonadetes bacterium]|nr:MBL fold metallo-hydrolase [Gemmatimonadota bacterium]
MTTRRHFVHSSALALAATTLDWRALLAHGIPARQPDLLTLVRGTVGTFTGRGGTIGWHLDAKSVVVVDSQFPDSAKTCLDAVNGRSNGRQVDYLVNTHHHGDHTGGNGVFRPAARKILAHANVPRLHCEAAERAVNAFRNAPPPPAPAPGAPPRPAPTPPVPPEQQVVADTTFERTWREPVGDEVMALRYYGAAHTSGDSVTTFEKANVVHMGDLIFNRRMPVIDMPGGASIAGWAKVLDGVLADHTADTIYIFGHAGANFPATGSRADLLVQRDFLLALLEFVRGEIKAGKSRDDTLRTTDPLRNFPDHGALTARVLGAAYDELTG